jgi:hypothetical protein
VTCLLHVFVSVKNTSSGPSIPAKYVVNQVTNVERTLVCVFNTSMISVFWNTGDNISSRNANVLLKIRSVN